MRPALVWRRKSPTLYRVVYEDGELDGHAFLYIIIIIQRFIYENAHSEKR